MNQSSNMAKVSEHSPSFGNIFKWKPNFTPKPGHAEIQSTSFSAQTSKKTTSVLSRANTVASRHTLSEEEAKQLDQECMARFLKINCKIVTLSKGCYEGVLIITPTALMFDPTNDSSSTLTSSTPSTSDDNNSRKLVRKRTKSQGQGEKSNKYIHSTIYDETNAVIPIEMISNVIMYEDLDLKDVHEYFDFKQNQE
jgi:hypothetical protein